VFAGKLADQHSVDVNGMTSAREQVTYKKFPTYHASPHGITLFIVLLLADFLLLSNTSCIPILRHLHVNPEWCFSHFFRTENKSHSCVEPWSTAGSQAKGVRTVDSEGSRYV
jgi:hypothetical protein